MFPAPAGMNRQYMPVRPVQLCVPRASGDEPYGLSNQIPVNLVFPAPAGMNRQMLQASRPLPSVPRASGDEPAARPQPPAIETVFPAPAGMNRMVRCYGFGVDQCSPRQRG